MIKFVYAADFHNERTYFDKLLPFLLDFKPDVFGMGGDHCDFRVISEFERHERAHMGTRECAKQVEKEISWANKLLDDVDKALPNSIKVWHKGNHDHRYDKYAHYEQCQHREEDRFIENRLRIKERGWMFVDIGGFYKLGKLYFLHGEKIGGSGGNAFAKIAAEKMRKNVRIWHHHTNQSFCITSPLGGGDSIEAKAIGCMCNRDPFYLKGMTNRWINSFLVGYVYPNGNFNDYIVNIINGQFIAPNGKIYK